MEICSSAPIKSYRDLIAWRKAMDLVLEIYRATREFPQVETYGIISQLRRAAVAIPSKIAEGHERLSTGDYRQFLGHALGSLMEIETQIRIAEELNYLEKDKSAALLERTSELGKILNGLLRSLRCR